MTLKTVDDLKTERGIMKDGETVYKEDLKQEAIKWVKADIEDRKTTTNPDLWDKGYWVGRNAFIKDFFNITEEDLK